MRINLLAIATSGVLVGSLFLVGCSTNFAPAPEVPVETAFGPIGGQIYGGQQPIVGAHIYAYQTSTSGYGTASKSLIAATPVVTGYTPVSDGTNYYVPTDSTGSFQISAATTCTSGTVVYLYSVSGQPTTGLTNPNAGEMAILGTCPSNGLLINAVTTGTSARIFMNEVSTVAAAYALAGFAETTAGVSTDALHIGNSGTALANTGIQNAAANASQLYTTIATAATTPGSTRAALATTPNGNGTVPQAEIDSIANVLAACINSVSPFNACTTLLNDDRSGGGQTGTKPTDTATAAIYLAQHPYSAYVTTIFNLGATAPPFSPLLTVAPNDFTISIVFTGGGMATSAEIAPHGLAIDGEGNVWKTNYGTSAATSTLSEFSPLGVPLSGSTGYTGNGLNRPTSVAIDTSLNVWVANFSGNSISKFSSAGAAVAAYSTGLALDNPIDAEIDSTGNIWIPNNEENTNTIVEMSSTGGLLKTSSGVDLNQPYSISFQDGTSGAWVVNENGSYYATHYNTTTDVENYGLKNAKMYGSAVDSSGTLWAAESATNVCAITTTAHSCHSTKSSKYSAPGPIGTVVDGANNIWATDTTNGTVDELSNSGTLLSPPYGYPAVGNATSTSRTSSTPVAPNAIAVDGSGDVWYTTTSDATVRELIGIAAPAITPLAYAVKNSTLGTRP